jgi:CDP-glycerol glycerophosphotransferase
MRDLTPPTMHTSDYSPRREKGALKLRTVTPVSARISVVVPIYNVGAYLDTCLESLAQQTVPDLEIVIVDDGSTDESPLIAERFVARDERFRLARQENAGQGAARNTGMDHATGEFLAFVDGDDVLPGRAYEAMLRALAQTGSDFATGKVRRLSSLGTTGVVFLTDAFDRERLKTHITRFPSLTADRLACNKLFRRSFWDRHRFRFPEGVRNEDIPVMLRAHYLADSVDVVAETVYWWRRREGGDLSGSQRRIGPKALRDRISAVDEVSRFLAERRMTKAKFLYDQSVVAYDLRYFLDSLDSATDDERRLFLDLANGFLDRTDQRVLNRRPAIERLKWHLVRRRALPELLEVLRFQVENLDETPPVRGLRNFYGDYPYRGDRRRRIPRRLYRLRDELAPVVEVEDVQWKGKTLRIEGYAYIETIGAPRAGAQKVDVVARSSGRRRRTVRLHVERIYRPDVTADAEQQFAALDWTGFVATLDSRRLKRRGRWRQGGWKIGIVVRSRGIVRESSHLEPAPLRAVPSSEILVNGARLIAGLTGARELEVRVRKDVPLLRSYVVDGNILRLEGDLGPAAADEPTLSVRRRDGGAVLHYPLSLDGRGDHSTFVAHVPIDDFVSDMDVAAQAANSWEQGEDIAWDLYLVSGRRRRLALHETAPESAWGLGGREIAVQRTRHGNATFVERCFRPVLTGVVWSPAGVLTVTGSFLGPPGEYELVLRRRHGGEAHAVPLSYDAVAKRFTAELRPGHVSSLAGTRPLAAGRWEFLVGSKGGAPARRVNAVLGHELRSALPISAKIGHKDFRVGVVGSDLPVLEAGRDLDEDERGGYRQRQLRTEFYRAQRRHELRDVVLYECFGGREYSDNPRSVHQELVRRDAPFEHVWVVRDGACTVPETAVAVRELSKEYYEAYASARYIVANDYWPRDFSRRPEQTWLQTWHGAPLKLLGYDLARRPKAVRAYRRVMSQSAENWQYVLSPGALATPILQRAFPPNACVIETGLPRTDMLLRPDRDRLAEDVKRRLGLPAHGRVVLYAPTYRDHLAAGDGYRLGLLLDLAALRAAMDEDDVLLFRKHRLMVGALPAEADGVLDVSEFPDATELLLAVDALVTDYSSAIFDFASLNRPMVFFTPDLETYRDQVRGFSIDFEREAPGPLLRTLDDVIDALRDLDGVEAAFRERYERFVATYCALNDGRAAGRVVDHVFRW